MEKMIKVRNSGFVSLQFIKDCPDGNLYIGESLKNIPFDIKRLYFINKLNNKKAIRGKHAHKECVQIIFCINGSFSLCLDDGINKQNLMMNNPEKGVILGKMLWHEMKDFSKDCVILVVASDYYNEGDYIRNYKEFKKLL